MTRILHQIIYGKMKLNDLFYREVSIRPILSLFLFLFMASSFVIGYNIYSPIWTYIIYAVTFACLFTEKNRNSKNANMYFFMFLLLMGASTLINGEDMRPYILVSSCIFLSAFYVYRYSFVVFRNAFSYIMTLLCTTSLLFYIAYMLYPSLYNVGQVTNELGETVSSFIINVYFGNKRNQSMFWEPGAFQTFINLALIFEVTKSRPNGNKITLFVVTLITTLSTTGYTVMALIMSWYIYKTGSSQKVKYIIILGLCVFVMLTYFSDLFFSTEHSTTFGKIISARESGIQSGGVTSASVRYYSVVKPIEVFFEHPLLGCGYQNLNEKLRFFTFGMNTCTFVNYFAVYGVLFGTLCISGFFKFVRILCDSNFAICLFMLIMFLITGSENYVHDAFIYAIIFYGFITPKNSITF